MREKILQPIKESTEDYERIENFLIDLFRKEIYLPLMAQLNVPKNTIQNAGSDALIDAIKFGRIYFSQGKFSGRFNSTTTKELRALGAKWDRKSAVFKIGLRVLPMDVRNAILASEVKFQEKIAGIDKKLAKILPDEIADKVQVQKMFDASLWKVEKDFQASVSKLTIAPKLTDKEAETISKEWNENMQLWVKDFTEKQIKKLRKDVQASVFAGNRYESMIATIQKSYDVSQSKAKFLARQETSLLMTKYKQTRYESAGVKEYIWGCVSGSANHPVRPIHKALEGKKFRWDDPPITDEKGTKNNPGQDYNCRCFARPVVRFK